MKTSHYFMMALMAISLAAQNLSADPAIGKWALIVGGIATSLLTVIGHVSPSAVNPAPAPAVVTAPVTNPAPAPAVVTAPVTTP